MSPVNNARACATLLGAQAVFAIAHLASGAIYAGYSRAFDVVTDVTIALVWIAAAVAGFVRRPLNLSFLLLVTGAFVSLVHGLLYSTVASEETMGAGLPFVVAATLELWFVVHAAPAFRDAAGQREHDAAVGADYATHHA
jgi:hypothetical protein